MPSRPILGHGRRVDLRKLCGGYILDHSRRRKYIELRGLFGRHVSSVDRFRNMQ